MPSGIRRALLCAAILACGAIALLQADGLAWTEMGGGVLTGPLITLCYGGGALFALGAALALAARGAAAVACCVAAVLCCPLYAYRIAPDTLRWLSPAPSSVQVSFGSGVDRWAVAGVLSLCILALAWAGTAARSQTGGRHAGR